MRKWTKIVYTFVAEQVNDQPSTACQKLSNLNEILSVAFKLTVSSPSLISKSNKDKLLGFLAQLEKRNDRNWFGIAEYCLEEHGIIPVNNLVSSIFPNSIRNRLDSPEISVSEIYSIEIEISKP